MAVLFPSRAKHVRRQAVVRVQEDRHLRGRESLEDREQGWIVESRPQPRRSHDHAARVVQLSQVADFVGDGIARGRGERQGAEEVETAGVLPAEGVQVFIQRRCGRGRLVGREEVQPGIGEGQDRDVDGVCVHEGDFLRDGVVFWPDGTPMRDGFRPCGRVVGRGGFSFGGQDYQTEGG